MAELLFWPALAAYGEATVAYVGETRRPGTLGRAAIWGVRLGWLLQTALLAVQASRSEGFPWASSGGALNLLAWLVVSAYLIWGCRPRYGLIGIGVAPIALVLLVLARTDGGLAGRAEDSGPLLALHALAMLTGFAALAVAAVLSALYLWHARRLKRRTPSILRLRMPPLEALDRLAVRTATVAVLALAGGVGLGAAALVAERGEPDSTMSATLLVWLLLVAYAVARRFDRLHPRRAAVLCLVGVVSAAAILPAVHYA